MSLDQSRINELIHVVLKGEKDKYSEIVDSFYPRVWRLVANKTPKHDIEVVVQTVFIKAYTALGSFSHDKPFEHWLSKIATNACIDYWRSKTNLKEQCTTNLNEDQIQVVSRYNKEGNKEFDKIDREDLLDNILSSLKPEDRILMYLIHRDGLSLSEASQKLNWSIAKTKVRAFRARSTMRKQVENIANKDSIL